MRLLLTCTESLLTPLTNTSHVRPSNGPVVTVTMSVVEPVSSSRNVSIGMVMSAACAGDGQNNAAPAIARTPMMAIGIVVALGMA